MPLQDLTPPPVAPQRTNDSETFNDRADAFVTWFTTFVEEMSALTAELETAASLLAVAPAYSDPTLTTIADAGLTPAADRGIYFTGAATAALFTLSSFGRSLTAAADAAAARTALGLSGLATSGTVNNDNWSGTDLAVTNGGTGASDASGARSNLGLGTMATQAASGVSITGGSVTGITDLAIADGGTGASSAAAALAALGGLGITSDDLASDGYIELSNGLFVFWGTFSATGNASTSFTYSTIDAGLAPTTFSRVVVSGGPATGGDNMPHVTGATTTGFTVFNNYSSSVTTFFIGVGV